MVKQGIRVEDIAEGMRLNRSTVFGWLRKYRQHGLKQLKSRKTTGAPSKLEQRTILKLMDLLRQPATDYGFASDLWTGPRVRILIRNKFGIKMHRDYMPRFLRRLGLVRKSPERRALEQDIKEVRRWKRYELPRITRSASQSKGIILYGDESVFKPIPHVGKTWPFPDGKPNVRVSGKKGISVAVTSAVSAQGHLLFQIATTHFNSGTLIKFMKSLHRHFINRKLFFIIDGAPCHKAKGVGRFALENASWLSLHYLPGYSPELNPDEEVWNTVKTQKLNAKPIKDKKELHSVVLGSLRSIQKRPEQIKEFFRK
ncbi:MAG: IS630 family transposase [Candidatus Brocadia sp.]|nr:MAG: IS630 family transposase [Candidatus Brocadia sp.]